MEEVDQSLWGEMESESEEEESEEEEEVNYYCLHFLFIPVCKKLFFVKTLNSSKENGPPERFYCISLTLF